MSRKGRIPYHLLAEMQGWPQDLDDYATIDEASDYYHFSKGYLCKLCRLKRIPSIKIGGKWFVKLSEYHRRE